MLLFNTMTRVKVNAIEGTFPEADSEFRVRGRKDLLISGRLVEAGTAL